MSNRALDHDNSERASLSLRIIPAVAFLLATVAMFLLGCFVVGPWYKNHSQAVETCTVVPPSLTHDGEDSPLPTPNRSSRTSEDQVSIKEITPSKSAQPAHRDDISISKESITPESKSALKPADEASSPSVVSTNTADSANTDINRPSPADSKPESETDISSQQLHRVRAGLFADKANADALSARLSSAGYVPSVHRIERDGRQLYVVQLGAFRSRENAEELAKSLRNSGFEASVAADK
ncbi:MAG: SPOR domain-containing protein [Armatimonadota bacterium]